jgi:hypothetical protein
MGSSFCFHVIPIKGKLATGLIADNHIYFYVILGYENLFSP